MIQKKSAFTLMASAVALVLLSVAAAAPTITFTFKDVVAKGATETDTYSINDAGAIAGDYVDSAGTQHAMILSGTKLTTVNNKNCQNLAGSTGLQFYGINSAGAAAGWCTGTTGAEIGFTWAKGKFTNISIKGAQLVNANGINDKGQIVGAYVDSSAVQHGFLLSGTKLTSLNPPGVTQLATAWSINDKGVITVFGLDSTGAHYLSFTTADNGKTYKAYHGKGEGKSGTQGVTTGTSIHTIDNLGDIVATVFDSAGNRHGNLFHAGAQYSFDDPKGKNATRADGINDKLGIVGRYSTSPSSSSSVGFFAQAK